MEIKEFTVNWDNINSIEDLKKLLNSVKIILNNNANIDELITTKLLIETK